jgi:uncharacterized Zn finger protein (UPF0148 family)
MEIVSLNRTLDQELLALMRGASLECPVCGEFVMHVRGGLVCPECGARFEIAAESRLQLGLQAG